MIKNSITKRHVKYNKNIVMIVLLHFYFLWLKKSKNIGNCNLFFVKKIYEPYSYKIFTAEINVIV